METDIQYHSTQIAIYHFANRLRAHHDDHRNCDDFFN
jgi:hypothetical protein